MLSFVELFLFTCVLVVLGGQFFLVEDTVLFSGGFHVFIASLVLVIEIDQLFLQLAAVVLEIGMFLTVWDCLLSLLLDLLEVGFYFLDLLFDGIQEFLITHDDASLLDLPELTVFPAELQQTKFLLLLPLLSHLLIFLLKHPLGTVLAILHMIQLYDKL